jgi:hypothetical protein
VAKEDESSTGRVWAAGFHHVTARSRLARVLKLTNVLEETEVTENDMHGMNIKLTNVYLFNFQFFFGPR